MAKIDANKMRWRKDEWNENKRKDKNKVRVCGVLLSGPTNLLTGS